MRIPTQEPVKVLYADPPWKFDDGLPGPTRGAIKHYDTMTVEQIRQFQLPWIDESAWLFLWRVHTHQNEAFEVMHDWGFRYCSEIVWVKMAQNGNPRIGMGRTIRMAHEVCIVGKRGKPEVQWKGFPSVILAPREEHSKKPEQMYGMIERFSPGPYCELFARGRRQGWRQYGKQLDAT